MNNPHLHALASQRSDIVAASLIERPDDEMDSLMASLHELEQIMLREQCFTQDDLAIKTSIVHEKASDLDSWSWSLCDWIKRLSIDAANVEFEMMRSISSES